MSGQQQTPKDLTKNESEAQQDEHPQALKELEQYNQHRDLQDFKEKIDKVICLLNEFISYERNKARPNCLKDYSHRDSRITKYQTLITELNKLNSSNTSTQKGKTLLSEIDQFIETCFTEIENINTGIGKNNPANEMRKLQLLSIGANTELGTSKKTNLLKKIPELITIQDALQKYCDKKFRDSTKDLQTAQHVMQWRRVFKAIFNYYEKLNHFANDPEVKLAAIQQSLEEIQDAFQKATDFHHYPQYCADASEKKSLDQQRTELTEYIVQYATGQDTLANLVIHLKEAFTQFITYAKITSDSKHTHTSLVSTLNGKLKGISPASKRSLRALPNLGYDITPSFETKLAKQLFLINPEVEICQELQDELLQQFESRYQQFLTLELDTAAIRLAVIDLLDEFNDYTLIAIHLEELKLPELSIHSDREEASDWDNKDKTVVLTWTIEMILETNKSNPERQQSSSVNNDNIVKLALIRLAIKRCLFLATCRKAKKANKTSGKNQKKSKNANDVVTKLKALEIRISINQAPDENTINAFYDELQAISTDPEAGKTTRSSSIFTSESDILYAQLQTIMPELNIPLQPQSTTESSTVHHPSTPLPSVTEEEKTNLTENPNPALYTKETVPKTSESLASNAENPKQRRSDIPPPPLPTLLPEEEVSGKKQAKNDTDTDTADPWGIIEEKKATAPKKPLPRSSSKLFLNHPTGSGRPPPLSGAPRPLPLPRKGSPRPPPPLPGKGYNPIKDTKPATGQINNQTENEKNGKTKPQLNFLAEIRAANGKPAEGHVKSNTANEKIAETDTKEKKETPSFLDQIKRFKPGSLKPTEESSTDSGNTAKKDEENNFSGFLQSELLSRFPHEEDDDKGVRHKSRTESWESSSGFSSD